MCGVTEFFTAELLVKRQVEVKYKKGHIAPSPTMVQSYSIGGASVHPHLTDTSLSPTKFIPQTAF